MCNVVLWDVHRVMSTDINNLKLIFVSTYFIFVFLCVDVCNGSSCCVCMHLFALAGVGYYLSDVTCISDVMCVSWWIRYVVRIKGEESWREAFFLWHSAAQR